MKFLKFDNTEYYPSITMDLLKKAINHARQFTTITPQEEETIMHCRKTLLIGNDDTIWMKKNNPDFDTPMGSLDSAEVFGGWRTSFLMERLAFIVMMVFLSLKAMARR